MNALIKTWRKDGFTLRLYDTGQIDSLGKSVLGYQLKDGRKIIFEGADFRCSPLHAVDSLATVYSLLSFLTLKPGDTDAEYFDTYTPTQMLWCTSDRCEHLAAIAMYGEERLSRRPGR